MQLKIENEISLLMLHSKLDLANHESANPAVLNKFLWLLVLLSYLARPLTPRNFISLSFQVNFLLLFGWTIYPLKLVIEVTTWCCDGGINNFCYNVSLFGTCNYVALG